MIDDEHNNADTLSAQVNEMTAASNPGVTTSGEPEFSINTVPEQSQECELSEVELPSATEDSSSDDNDSEDGTSDDEPITQEFNLNDDNLLNRLGFTAVDEEVDEDMEALTVKTKNELLLEDLPLPEPIKIDLPSHAKFERIGKISSIFNEKIVVEATKYSPALDIDSILFVSDKKPLGKIVDVFGPVEEPYYLVRVNRKEQKDVDFVALEKKLRAQDFEEEDNDELDGTCTFIFAVTNIDDMASYVLTAQLKKLKGTDASWKDDEEPPENAKEYSDDEEERMAKQATKKKRKKPENHSIPNKQRNPNPNPHNDNDRRQQQQQYNYIGGNNNMTFNSPYMPALPPQAPFPQHARPLPRMFQSNPNSNNPRFNPHQISMQQVPFHMQGHMYNTMIPPQNNPMMNANFRMNNHSRPPPPPPPFVYNSQNQQQTNSSGSATDSNKYSNSKSYSRQT